METNAGCGGALALSSHFFLLILGTFELMAAAGMSNRFRLELLLNDLLDIDEPEPTALVFGSQVKPEGIARSSQRNRKQRCFVCDVDALVCGCLFGRRRYAETSYARVVAPLR